ncbi:GTP-binding protein EngB required for normal cell division [Paenibacillus sp. LBL]|uniref:hypothetical protein n=1 Tax=Paenibacillus sp. LBL TaxID=2940563 RepID=UPI002475DF26|nr:hypothetical protein [Paenibacillus sp. LBL]MDH6671241.1 GTP-binding protein EngB required for normal cell division [Paenibacillus sp. LBL]
MVIPAIPRSFAPITATDALKRSNQYPSAAVFGPSGSGKSALTNALMNAIMAKLTLMGVGEKNQTTLISTNYVLDSRVSSDKQFALKLVIKPFEAKQVLIVLREKLFDTFSIYGNDADDTVEAMDDEWFQSVLEPKDASYHLGSLQAELNLEILRQAVLQIIKNIEEVDGKSFAEIVKERKKDPSAQGRKIKDVRADLFEDLWDNQDKGTRELLDQWLEKVGQLLVFKLTELFHCSETMSKDVLLIDNADLDDESNKNVLSKLYDPLSPFSLIVKEMTIACRPREELVRLYPEDRPFRFCIRDTVGLTQTGTDDESIRSALEIGLNYRADSLLILFSLEERNDVLMSSCNLIAEKMEKNGKLQMPVHVLFTKADKLIETKIDLNKEGLKLTQKDYNKQIFSAIKEVDDLVRNISGNIPECTSKWISLRYRDEDLDPIQIALRDNNDAKKLFQPEGMYQFINELVNDIQTNILPAGMDSPLFITTKNPNKPAISIQVGNDNLKSILDRIQYQLTEDTVNVNGYLITTKFRLSGHSVVTYWRKLQKGIGHTTNAKVYGNFSINMKGLLRKVLRECIGSIDVLYQKNEVATLVGNLKEQEIERLILSLGEKAFSEKDAFDGLNQGVLARMDAEARYAQLLHVKLREYFNNPIRYERILDLVAFQLSYGNSEIQKKLKATYDAPVSYDQAMRNVQYQFKDIFASNDFRNIVVKEFENAMTNMINKLFVAI